MVAPRPRLPRGQRASEDAAGRSAPSHAAHATREFHEGVRAFHPPDDAPLCQSRLWRVCCRNAEQRRHAMVSTYWATAQMGGEGRDATQCDRAGVHRQRTMMLRQSMCDSSQLMSLMRRSLSNR